MRATSSLPVPVSPTTRTDACEGATRASVFMTWMMAGLWPTSAGSVVCRERSTRARRLADLPASDGRHAPAPQRASERFPQRGDVVWLADEIVRAGPDGFTGSSGVTECRENQHQRAGIALTHGAQQIQTAGARHTEIGEDGVEGSRLSDGRERLFHREGRDDLVRLAFEYLGQEPTRRLVVVYQEQPRGWDLRGPSRSWRTRWWQSKTPARAASRRQVDQVAARGSERAAG